MLEGFALIRNIHGEPRLRIRAKSGRTTPTLIIKFIWTLQNLAK